MSGPVLVVAVALSLLLGARLAVYHGNATGLVQFGRHFVQDTHPPRDAIVASPDGYDGQFFWVQANDPLLLHDKTIANLTRAGAAFRLQRVAYPALSALLALGQLSVIPWTLLAVNVLVLLGLTVGFAVYARHRAWSVWWALVVVLTPGLVLATMRDLSDPLATASMIGGLLLWQQGRKWWAAALLGVAVLAREPMILAVAAVAIDTFMRWWHCRRERGSLRRAVRYAWPAVVLPIAVFLAWQAYADARYGGNAAASSHGFRPPLTGISQVVRGAFDSDPRNGMWDLIYIGMMLAGIGAAFALVQRRVTAPNVAAILFALSLLVLEFGDEWSYTRLSAPLFATLLLGGLEQRSRFAVTIAVAAAAMTVLVPLAIRGA